MKNVEVTRDGNKLVLTMDLTQDHGPSASGKTVIIATTAGNKPVANVDGQEVYLGLNLYRYASPKEDR